MPKIITIERIFVWKVQPNTIQYLYMIVAIVTLNQV